MSRFFLHLHLACAKHATFDALSSNWLELKSSTASLLRPDREEELTLMIGAMKLDSFEQRLGQYDPNRLLLVVEQRYSAGCH